MSIRAQKRIDGVLYEAELERCTPQEISWVLVKPAGWKGRRFRHHLAPRYGAGLCWYRAPYEDQQEKGILALGMRDNALLFLSDSLGEFHGNRQSNHTPRRGGQTGSVPG